MRICLLKRVWSCVVCLRHLKAPAASAFVGAPFNTWRAPHPLPRHQGAHLSNLATMGPPLRKSHAVDSSRNSKSSSSKISSCSNSSNNSSKSISSGRSSRSVFHMMPEVTAFALSCEEALGGPPRGLSFRRKAPFTKDQGGPSKTRRLLKREPSGAPSMDTHERQQVESKPEKARVLKEETLHANTSVTAAALRSSTGTGLSPEDWRGRWMDLRAPPEELRPSACLMAGEKQNHPRSNQRAGTAAPKLTREDAKGAPRGALRGPPGLRVGKERTAEEFLVCRNCGSALLLQHRKCVVAIEGQTFRFSPVADNVWEGPVGRRIFQIKEAPHTTLYRCVFDGEGPLNGGPSEAAKGAPGAHSQEQEAALRRFFQLDVGPRGEPRLQGVGAGSPGGPLQLHLLSQQQHSPEEERQRASRGGPLGAPAPVSLGTFSLLSPPSLKPPRRPSRGSVGSQGIIPQIDRWPLGPLRPRGASNLGGPSRLRGPRSFRGPPEHFHGQWACQSAALFVASYPSPPLLLAFVGAPLIAGLGYRARLVRGAAEKLIELGGPSFLEALRWQKPEAEGPPFAHLKAATTALLQLPLASRHASSAVRAERPRVPQLRRTDSSRQGLDRLPPPPLSLLEAEIPAPMGRRSLCPVRLFVALLLCLFLRVLASSFHRPFLAFPFSEKSVLLLPRSVKDCVCHSLLAFISSSTQGGKGGEAALAAKHLARKQLSVQLHAALQDFYRSKFGAFAGWAQSVLFACALKKRRAG
ncbi:hypothetical protein Esti_005090 [Eimeria stiedai]